MKRFVTKRRGREGEGRRGWLKREEKRKRRERDEEVE